jgi:hypothetical protein
MAASVTRMLVIIGPGGVLAPMGHWPLMSVEGNLAWFVAADLPPTASAA